MLKVDVDLGLHSYPIVIGQNLLTKANALLRPFLQRSRVFVIADAAITKHYREGLCSALEGMEILWFTVPSGEASKSYAQFERLCNALLAEGIERRDTILAFGGGVVGDLAGYVAASLLRGVAFVQIPTTLLAQVDSSVGGKTGINTPNGKNLVGAFYQPKLVIIDTDVLKTLPMRELRAGYAEILKYGLINRSDFYYWLLDGGKNVLALEQEALTHAIEISCKTKAAIVAEDEREEGARALLNLGHTFAHALEALAGYDGRLLHGEAVAIGMVLAHNLSARLGYCNESLPGELKGHLKAMGLPTEPNFPGQSTPEARQLVTLMGKDKKVDHGKIGFILSKGVGQAFQCKNVPEEVLLDCLRAAGCS